MTEVVESEVEVANTAPSSIDELQRKVKLTGTVKRIELYGAFVDIGIGLDTILHVSQVVGGKRIKDVIKVGDEIEVYADKIDVENKKVMVTMFEPLAVEWQDLEEGKDFVGTVTRHENFGAFVNIGAEKEGLVHISEISHEYIRHPSQAVSVGSEVNVKVLSYSRKKRRINLSIKALIDAPEKEVEDYIGEVFDLDEDEPEVVATSMEVALRRAMGDDAPPRKPSKKKRRKGRRREQQDDIIGRTLDYSR